MSIESANRENQENQENQERWLWRILYQEAAGPGVGLLRTLLAGVAQLHILALKLILWTERAGLRKRFRVRDREGKPIPVVTIGNLSSGGTGKTPMAALVAGRFYREGRRVVVLSRGHGGSNEATRQPRIVSDGKNLLLGPEEAGDEPALLARLLPGVPLIVCRDRRKSARLAAEQFQPDILVLDDGLQHWKLHRDLDIALLDARRPFDNGYVLPRGLLREPPSHLCRAGVIVLTRADRVTGEALAETMARVRRLAPEAAVFSAIHAPMGWLRASDGSEFPLDFLKGRQALAFSGIADGQAFADTVSALGLETARVSSFGDHHRYTGEEITALIARFLSPEMVAVTTEKDLVKVASLWPPDAPPLYALRIGMKISDEARFWEQLRSRIDSASPRAERTVERAI